MTKKTSTQLNGISAIVATLNRKDQLFALFNSLLHNSNVNLELIIVDQNDGNFLHDVIVDYQDKLDIKHVKFKHKHLSKARNFGVSLAKYP
ncbi:MAG TPA: glycosyltransferase, partial [Segetibacter sp.]